MGNIEIAKHLMESETVELKKNLAEPRACHDRRIILKQQTNELIINKDLNSDGNQEIRTLLLPLVKLR